MHLVGFPNAKVGFESFEKFSHYFYDTDQVVKNIYFSQSFTGILKQIETYIRN